MKKNLHNLTNRRVKFGSKFSLYLRIRYLATWSRSFSLFFHQLLSFRRGNYLLMNMYLDPRNSRYILECNLTSNAQRGFSLTGIWGELENQEAWMTLYRRYYAIFMGNFMNAENKSCSLSRSAYTPKLE